MEDLLKKSKWINSEGKVTNWPEFAKDMGWISQAPAVQFGQKAKKYLPHALRDLGSCHFYTAKTFYTDDCPLKEGDSPDLAILTDNQGSGNCWLRLVRIEAGQIFVASPQWPYGEVPFPIDFFQSIERVLAISYR